jgi:NADH-quinone oxidoreductase subunit J
MESGLFYVLGTISVLAACNVVAQHKVFYGAISLIICLAALSGIYMLLEAPFIAAVQVIVYAGAIMVLFLFVIMLLDPFATAEFVDKRRYLRYVAVILGVAVLALVVPLIRGYDGSRVPRPVGGSSQPSVGTVQDIGRSIFTDYFLPFEATSALILVAIAGAVVLAKRKA